MSKEFRIIASLNYPNGHPLKPDGDFLKLPPEALVGVIVGCKGDYAEVAKVVNEYAPGLPVKRIVQITGSPLKDKRKPPQLKLGYPAAYGQGLFRYFR
jgi:hypothetical protein